MKAYNPSTSQWEDVYVKALDSFPVGVIVEYPTTDSAKLPTGYLFCDGSAISRTEYSELFSLIGTSFGSGDGSTTFNIPSKKGLVTAGINSSDTDFDTIGETLGEKTHKLTVQELASHSHLMGSQGGTQTSNYYMAVTQNGANSMATQNTGGNQPHNNIQPTQVSNFIIKVKPTRVLASTVVNAYSGSTENAYSCDYINNLKQAGKLLWSGSFTSGSITVPDLSKYSLLAVSLNGGIICIGNATWGIGGIGAYGSYNINVYGYRFTVSGNTLTIDNANRGGSDGTQNVAVVAIRGIY